MKIFFVQHCSAIGGASWCMLELIRGLQALDKSMECEVLLFEEGPLEKRLRSIGVPVEVDSSLRTITPLYDGRPWWVAAVVFLRSLFRLPQNMIRFHRYCKKIAPDIVHLNSSALFAYALPAKLAGVQKVFLHNREHWWADGILRPKTWLKNVIVKHYVDRIFSITEAYTSFFGFKEKTTLVHDWPSFDNEELYDVRKELGIGADDFLILVPGGSGPAKGAHQLLKSLEYVANLERIKVIVLGFSATGISGGRRVLNPHSQQIRYSDAMLQMRDVYAGQVFLLPPTLNVKSYMSACNVVVCPFMIPHAAKAALEASSLGKPVIISRNDEALEYVLEDRTGLLVNPLEPKEVAAALDFFVNFPDVAMQFGNNGLEFINDRFEKHTIMKTLMDIYNPCV